MAQISFPLILTQGFGINTNILETNLINLSVVIGIVVYFGGGFLVSLLSTRREAIIDSLQDAEKRYMDAIERFTIAEQRLDEAQKKAEIIRLQGEQTARDRSNQLREALNDDIQRLSKNVNSLIKSEKAKILEQVCNQVVNSSLGQARTEINNQQFLTTQQHDRVNGDIIGRLPQTQLV